MHNVVKINLSRSGYLPNYPYHLISDSEMCDAFLAEDGSGYFKDQYPLPSENLQSEYDALVAALRYWLDMCKNSDVDEYEMPDWVYTYMIGGAISSKSDDYDKYDLAVLLNLDDVTQYGEFTETIAENCYEISYKWLNKLGSASRYVFLENGTRFDTRPPTIFGEPHVIKYLRLQQVRVGEERF